MKKFRFSQFVAPLLCGLALSACSLEPLNDDWKTEMYTRSFIKEFGLIDPKQDWNMARSANVAINLDGTTPSDVKIYGYYEGKYYLAADLKGVSGEIVVPIDIPEDCNELVVSVNGKDFKGEPGKKFDCTLGSRGIPGHDYEQDGYTNGKFTYNPSNPTATATVTAGAQDFSFTVSHTTEGNRTKVVERGLAKNLPADNGEYQYFNTQQIAPVVSIDAWPDYVSLNMGDLVSNTNKVHGIVPEEGTYNRTAAQQQQTYEDAQSILDLESPPEKDYQIINDFIVSPGSDGKFTIFPYYYGALLKHKLGLYLVDENDNPLKKDGTKIDISTFSGTPNIEDLVTFEFFDDKEKGDMQIAPRFAQPTAIRVLRLNDDGEVVEGNDDNGITTLNIEKGKTVNIKVEVKLDGTWKELPLNQYTNRISYHIWNQEETFASYTADYRGNSNYCTVKGEEEGQIYMQVGIALSTKDNGHESSNNQGDGIAKTITINIGTGGSGGNSGGGNTGGTTETHFKSEHYSGWPAGIASPDFDNDIYTSTTTVTSESDEVVQFTVKINLNDIPSSIKSKYDNGADANPRYNDYVDIDGNKSYLLEEVYNYYVTNLSSWYNDNKNNSDAYVIYQVIDGGTANGTKIYHIDKYEAKGIATGISNSYESSLADLSDGTWSFTNMWNWNHSEYGAIGVLFELDGGINGRKEVTTTTTTTWDWTSNGRDLAREALTTYYRNHPLSNSTCTTEGCTETNFTVDRVEFEWNTPHDNFQYTVYWKHDVTTSSSKPRQWMSRAEGDAIDLLDYNNTDGWVEVNQVWSRYMPEGEEVASFCTDNPMLARSRGYVVELKVKNEEGQYVPYTGKVGLYLKVEEYGLVENDLRQELPYYHFSQKALNGANKYSYAYAFNHPTSGRPFFGFEDLRIMHEAPYDNSWTGTDINGYARIKEQSSDRDSNDLVFLIDGIDNFEGDDKVVTTDPPKTEETFSWIWALEDLGSVDDFDFNDVVMKISGLTVTQNSTTPGVAPTITKQVVFTPLAAGGTLPVFIHLYVKGTDYLLRPGTFNVADDNEENDPSTTNGLEWHEWFRSGMHWSNMLNTRKNSVKYNGSPCNLIVPDGFTINIFDQEGKYYDTYRDVKNSSDAIFFYATVDGSDAWTVIDAERTKDEDGTQAYLLPLPERGQAPQSFVVKGTWEWPSERSHIMQAYPNFGKWVQGKLSELLDWTADKNSEYLY